jgi:hypothetical protein
MGSQHFSNNEELMEGVNMWLNLQEANFFDTGIQKLIPQYDTCLNSGGDYVKKLLKYVHIFIYNEICFFPLQVLLTAHWRLLSQ